MSSNLIYSRKTDRTPYFYIIQHIPSGKLYAGCRYAKGCHPSEFMQPGGYCTSSNTIRKIIESEGLDVFKTIRIMTESECGIDVYDYENMFLRNNKIAQRDNWFNAHNNTNFSFHNIEYQNAMLKIYGVIHSSQSEVIQETRRNNNIQKYGVPHYSMLREIREKAENTSKERYGTKFPIQLTYFQEKKKETCLLRYGYENTFQVPEIKVKIKETNLARYGVEHPTQSEEIQEKTIKTNLERYGVERPMQSEEIRKKAHQTNLERYGTPYAMHSKEHTCPHCSKVGIGGNMKRHHFDNCKLNPNRKPQEIFTCPHCSYSCSSSANMKRHHFDNCKLNPNFIYKEPELYTCPHCGEHKIKAVINRYHMDKCKRK